MFGRRGPMEAFGQEVRRAKDVRETLARLGGYLGRRKRQISLAVSMVIVSSLLGVAGPWMLGTAIDRYVSKHDLHGLAGMCLVMLAVYVSGSLLNWLQTYVMVGVAQQTVRDIRADLFARVQTFALRFFDTRSDGELMSRLTNDVESLNVVLSDSVAQIVSSVLTMVGVVIAMVWIQPILAVVSIFGVALPTFLLNRWLGKVIRTGFRGQQKALGELNGLIEETITGQRVVAAFRREPIVIGQFAKHNVDLREHATKAQTYGGVIGPFMNAFGNLGLALVAVTGAFLCVRGVATAGLIATFMMYSRQLGFPLSNIANLYNSIQSALAGAERVFEIIDEPSEIDAQPSAEPKVITGEVELRDVSFSYVEGKPVLQNVDLHALPGQTIALVGPTGAGKTTIVNLLTRFYEIDSGQILIDGSDLRSFPKEELRRQLGIVLQDTFLFTGTVRENIRYGRLEATEEEIVAAAKLANVDAFVHHLPNGYDTVLSERAGNLSHGQRQLLAIARAILADPRILILDEATSSVDTRTEQHIQEAMLRLMEGRTSFVIAHRLSTIRQADQILVIQDGRVSERGTHDELRSAGGFYAKLVGGVKPV